jgi:hypothetical protein
VDPVLLSAAKLVSRPVTAATLRAVLAIEDARTRQLGRIEAKIDALMEASYRAGLQWLRDAAAAESDAERSRCLDRASDKFRDAVAVFEATDHLLCSWAASYIALIDGVSGRRASAGRWSQRAYEEAVAAVVDGCADANDKLDGKVGRVKFAKATLFLTNAGFRATLAYEGLRRRQLRPRLETLHQHAAQVLQFAAELGADRSELAPREIAMSEERGSSYRGRFYRFVYVPVSPPLGGSGA